MSDRHESQDSWQDGSSVDNSDRGLSAAYEADDEAEMSDVKAIGKAEEATSDVKSPRGITSVSKSSRKKSERHVALCEEVKGMKLANDKANTEKDMEGGSENESAPRGVHFGGKFESDDRRPQRRRGRSIVRRQTKRSSNILAYQLRALRHQNTLDALPVPETKDGAAGDKENVDPTRESDAAKVLRADSVSQDERRGRGYFRGIGANFSSSANRTKGRTPSMVRNTEVYSRRGVLVSRAISPSPDRARIRRTRKAIGKDSQKDV